LLTIREPFILNTGEYRSLKGALDRPKNDWTLECNMVAWNGGDPKIDIRSWSPDHRKMTRGITLTEEQGEKLIKSLGQRMLDKQKARSERDPYER